MAKVRKREESTKFVGDKFSYPMLEQVWKKDEEVAVQNENPFTN